MREMKFRVWTGSAMEYRLVVGALGAFYVEGIDPKDSACLSPFNTKYSDQVPVMQFTGLCDKNGKEIYEGDIVRNDDKYYPINPVIYCAEIINDHDGDWDEWYCGFCLEDVDHTPLSSDVEVIGNIYEHPELLKGK